MSKKWMNKSMKLLEKIDSGYSPAKSDIDMLESVTELDLSGYNHKTLPASIHYLSALKKLVVDSSVTSLPDSIGRLVALETLELSGTHISTLPISIGNLTSLRELYLYSSSIIDLPDSIGKLISLEILSVANTRVQFLPDSIGNLINLRRLYLNYTKIRSLPNSIEKLVSLKGLYLSCSSLNSISDKIGNLTELEELYLDGTAITCLPNSICNLTALQVLNLSYTKITTLPKRIGKLPNLQMLDLSELKLDMIPETLAKKDLPFVDKVMLYSEKSGINLHNVTLTQQRLSYFFETPELIPDLYIDQVTLPECKIIFLGNGAAGKSYTIKRFINDGKKESEEAPYITTETPGVDIVNYHVEKGKDSFDIHFWDFGGQQILHSMHRCFLTENTCYVVVVNTRDTEGDRHAHYWLQNVTAFAPESPILLLVNCWENDNGKRLIDENRLLKSFPAITDVIYCSAKQASENDFCSFMDSVIDMAEHSKGCRQTVNRKWDDVKRSILAENTDFLTKERYYQICNDNGIKDADAAPLLTFFNNLGVCFSYHRDREKKELAEYKLLNPVWLTNAIYAIIEEGEASAFDGRIKKSAIENMLCNPAPKMLRNKEYRRTMPDIIYEESHCGYIIDVAVAHNLCYRIKNDIFFFPALCTNNTPVDELENQEVFPNHIEYQLEYQYLPDSVVHQLMIRCLRKSFTIQSCWLRGMVIGGIDWYKAIIRIDDNYKSLIIDMYSKGNYPANVLFHILRDEMLEINRELNLKAKEYIAKDGDRFTILQLLASFNDGQDVVYGNNTGEKYSVKQLLGMFYDEKTIMSMMVVKDTIVIPREEIKLHECKQDDVILRKAIWKVYKGVCQYCNNPIKSYREMQIDHVFPEKYKRDSLPQIEEYIKYLRTQGFNIDKPHYIENYLPAHESCNKDKSNHINTFPLVWYHSISIRNASKILRVMESTRRTQNN